jgi:hypothetical protein
MSDAQQSSGSEVARILLQIREEYQAAKLGLSGLAEGTSRHAFVTKKMETMGQLQLELGSLIGNRPAIALIAEHLNDIPDRTVGIVPCADPSPSAEPKRSRQAGK